MDDAHRLWHHFLRAAQPHELHADDNDDDGGVEQIDDDLMTFYGSLAS